MKIMNDQGDHLIADWDYMASEMKGEELRTIRYMVFHDSGGMNFESATELYVRENSCKESMHLIIGPNPGDTRQLIPFNRVAWHAGASYWQGHHGLNTCSLGICLTNENGISEEQLDVLDIVVPTLVQAFHLRDLMTHSQISPGQIDPQDFPLERYLPWVRLGNAESLGKFTVVGRPDTHVRGGPDVNFHILDKLGPGSTVRVLRQSGDWYFVVYQNKDNQNTHGWCHESFLRRV